MLYNELHTTYLIFIVTKQKLPNSWKISVKTSGKLDCTGNSEYADVYQTTWLCSSTVLSMGTWNSINLVTFSWWDNFYTQKFSPLAFSG